MMPDDRTPQERQAEVDGLMPDEDRRGSALADLALSMAGLRVPGRRSRDTFKPSARHLALLREDDQLPPGAPTETELSVLRALSHGLSCGETAVLYGSSRHTIHQHLAAARLKLSAKNAAQTVATAMRLGMIP